MRRPLHPPSGPRPLRRRASRAAARHRAGRLSRIERRAHPPRRRRACAVCAQAPDPPPSTLHRDTPARLRRHRRPRRPSRRPIANLVVSERR
eukprot:2621049-Prymnesium_polylepis.1